jgi:chromosome segregation ATPase
MGAGIWPFCVDTMKVLIGLLCLVSCAWANGEEAKPAGAESSDVSIQKEKTGIWIQKEGARKWLSNEQIVDHFIEQITLRDKIEEAIHSMAQSAVQKEEILRQRQQTITDLKVQINDLRDRLLNLQSELGKAQASGQMQMVLNEEVMRELNRRTEQLSKKNEIILKQQQAVEIARQNEAQALKRAAELEKQLEQGNRHDPEQKGEF